MTHRPDDTPIDVNLVRTLISIHFPQWAELPISEFQPAGTQNAVFCLGQEFCLRLPRRPRAAVRLEKEVRWLPIIGRQGNVLETPMPVAMVSPTAVFGMPWAIYKWIEGERFTLERSLNSLEAALKLAKFLMAFRRIDTEDAPLSQVSTSLVARDHEVRRAIALLGDTIDQERATAAWERSLDEPTPRTLMAWTHGDLLAANLLLRNGQLAAVIDFGYAGIGDPALDLLPAWSAFDAEGRKVFRQALDVDDSTWLRGRGFALHTMVAIAAAHFHRGGETLGIALRMLEAVLSDCS